MEGRIKEPIFCKKCRVFKVKELAVVIESIRELKRGEEIKC
jgi:hypothetical protein